MIQVYALSYNERIVEFGRLCETTLDKLRVDAVENIDLALEIACIVAAVVVENEEALSGEGEVTPRSPQIMMSARRAKGRSQR